MTTPEIGALLEGRYRLDGILGQGGMATVFRARDTRLDRAVAVKVLRPEVLADPSIAARFRREAHAATVLRHPNIVACLDVGTEGDTPFLVMELVEGEDLATRIRRDAPLSVPATLRVAADVGLGLGVAHARGFVHRDVKPGNILIAGDGRAMVTDFGIARLIADADAEATSPGTTLGSVHYLSPEQVSGGTATAASDVYGLGLVLYEMLTGARAWSGDTPAAIAVARVNASAPSVRAVRPDVPDEVEALVGRALSTSPRDRFPNGTAFAGAAEAAGRPPDPFGATAVVEVAPVVRRSTRRARQAGRPTWVTAAPLVVGTVLFTLVVLAFLGGGIGAFIGPSTSPTQGSTPFPSRESPATIAPSATPSLTPTAEPTPIPTPTPLPDKETGELCVPGPVACPIPAGRHRSPLFEPTVEVDLDGGWSAVRHYEDAIVIGRSDGLLTLASGVSIVYRKGAPIETKGKPDDLVDALQDNPDVSVRGGSDQKVAGQRATILELAPVGSARVPIFDTSRDTFFIEADTVTWVAVFEAKKTTIILVLEGADGSDLDTFRQVADPVVESLRFR